MCNEDFDRKEFFFLKKKKKKNVQKNRSMWNITFYIKKNF